MSSGSPDPHAEYRRRLEHRREAAARDDLRHRRIAGLRLAVFAATVLLGWFIFKFRALTFWWLPVPLAGFIALVIMHERALRSRCRMERSVVFYERGLARLTHSWIGSGETGDRFLDARHPYARDLDLFGTGSLFELLCTARTRSGEETLAEWLQAPASLLEIARRQAGISELKPGLDLREDMAVLGADLGSGVDPEILTGWSRAPAVRFPRAERVIAKALAVSTVSALALVFAFDGGRTWFLALALFELCFALRMRARVSHVIRSVERPGRDLALLSQVLARLERESFRSPMLVELRRALECDGRQPSRQIARLNRLIRLLESRRNLLFAPAAALLLWPVQFAFAIEDWREESGALVPRWLQAVGEIEALCAFAGYGYEHPSDPFPEIVEGGPCFEGTGIGHPLVAEDRSVPNDVRLGTDQRVLLVSGSNMSGKSTLLRTVGSNAVLALAGAPVRARNLRISPMSIGASLRILDSLQEGSSRFYAEITRLRQIVELAEGSSPLLFLLDELLHGTNSHDRRIGAEAIIRGMVKRGAIGIMTTHDLALSHIADDLSLRAVNVHFEDHIEEGRIAFDYLLQPGIVRRSNALELMRSIGLEV